MAYSSRMEFFVICFLAIVLIMVAMYFGAGPVSGASSMSKLSGEPYEGFTDAMKYFSDREGEKKEEKKEGFALPKLNNATTQYQSTGGVKNVSGTHVPATVTRNGFKDIGLYKPQENGIKVEGFAGLQSGPLNESAGLMSFLRDNEASPTCPGYGYTKSTGNICMSPEDIRLLTTRGGNATGR